LKRYSGAFCSDSPPAGHVSSLLISVLRI
jgi:hypothetical protein